MRSPFPRWLPSDFALAGGLPRDQAATGGCYVQTNQESSTSWRLAELARAEPREVGFQKKLSRGRAEYCEGLVWRSSFASMTSNFGQEVGHESS